MDVLWKVHNGHVWLSDSHNLIDIAFDVMRKHARRETPYIDHRIPDADN